jgi:hypothetical protein
MTLDCLPPISEGSSTEMTSLLRRFPTVAVGLAFSPCLIDLALPHSAARERWLAWIQWRGCFLNDSAQNVKGR